MVNMNDQIYKEKKERLKSVLCVFATLTDESLCTSRGIESCRFLDAIFRNGIPYGLDLISKFSVTVCPTICVSKTLA